MGQCQVEEDREEQVGNDQLDRRTKERKPSFPSRTPVTPSDRSETPDPVGFVLPVISSVRASQPMYLLSISQLASTCFRSPLTPTRPTS